MNAIHQESQVVSDRETTKDCTLTKREREVLDLMRRGYRNREIATELSIMGSTVHKHIQNIFEKLHARNRSEAIYLANAGAGEILQVVDIRHLQQENAELRRLVEAFCYLVNMDDVPLDAKEFPQVFAKRRDELMREVAAMVSREELDLSERKHLLQEGGTNGITF
jgi:DNA-binding CsgD family transcriptional regulator